MADLEKQERVGVEKREEEEEEKERFLEGMAVLDFDMLCSTVALQTQQGQWRSFGNVPEEEEGGGEFSGVLRMWEGQVLDCYEDRRIALETAWSVIPFCFSFSLSLLFWFFHFWKWVYKGTVCFDGKCFPESVFVF